MRLKNPGKILTYAVLPLLLVLVLAISYFRILDSYELETLDARFRLRPKPVTTDKIVLIEIGDDTIKNLGQWPIQRNYHALLIKALADSGARAIIYDIFFGEEREYDDALEYAIRDAGMVYLPSIFELDPKKSNRFAVADKYNAKNLSRFSDVSKGEGHINIFPDIDGKFRRIPPVVKYKKNWHPYISFLATCNYLGIPAKDITMVPRKYISCGPIKIPLDDSSNIIINFSGKWKDAYKHYSFYDIVQSYLAQDAGQKPILDLGIFKDKVCVVGLTATGTVDLHPNPLEQLYPGFGIHAEIFNSMLNGLFISRASRGVNLAILIFLILLTVLVALKIRPVVGLLFVLAMEALFGISGILFFNIFGIWIDLFYPAVALVLIYLSLTLYKYMREWKKMLLMESELNIAKRIQESFLPKSLPHIEGAEIEAAMFTAKQVGGDLYDFRIFSPSKLGVMIGDVSGKGVPASLFMAMVTSEFKFLAAPQAAPESVLSGLNARLVKESSSNLFVTMFYMIFDIKALTARFSNGAHLPVIHLVSGGGVELLDVSEGTPLGLVDSEYGSKEIKFKKGDLFVFYTDGVTEAMDKKGNMYGQERLISAVKANSGLSSKELLGKIEKDVRRFEPKSNQHDDITLLVIKIV